MAFYQGANIPDFFIVGAPKCGTTSLHYYLQQHHSIFMGNKELHFFGKDFTYRDASTPLEYYLSFFKDAPANQFVGEASVWYLYSTSAAQEIKQFNPDAKIIIMLRNPVDMIYSLHSEQLYNGNENIRNFKQALNAEETRRNGKLIPPNIGCPLEALQYKATGLYYKQVKRYYDVFGRDKIHIVLLKDIKANTSNTFKKVLNFLNVEEDISIDYTVQNKNKVARSYMMTNLLRKRSKKWIQLVKFLIPKRSWRLQVQAQLWKLNAKPADRRDMPLSLKKELAAFYQEDIEQLENLLNIDLSHWK